MFTISAQTPALRAQSLLIERILYLEDEKNAFSPNEALHNMEEKGVVWDGIRDQYSDSSHWFLLNIRALQNESPTDFLHVKNTLISVFEAWRLLDGQLVPMPTREVLHRYPLLQPKVKIGEEFQILLKVFLPDITGLEFETTPPALTGYESPFNSFSFGFILAGFAAGLLIYNLILFLFLRDLDLANFSLYAFCLIIASFGATGGFMVLGLPPWVNRWVGCVAAISVASGLNFTRSFLNTKQISPVFDKILLAGEISNLLCCALLALDISRKVQYLIDINMLLSLGLAIVFAIYAWRQGYALARNYLLGWIGYVVALVPFIGLQYDWIQRNMLTENAPMFALDFQVLVLSSAIGTKITRMRAELLTKLQDANNALEKKVEERTRTVIEQQQTLIQTAKMASLGEMAGGIAHEINNPLMIINGYSENLSTLIQKNQLTQEKAVAFHERILKATERIRNIVNGLRTLSREASNDELSETTLKDLVKDALSLCENRFSNHGVDLRVVLPTKDVRLRCNAGQICQILINLLNNAFDAIETIEGAWVEIRAEDFPDHISIRLIDCGQGIDPKVVERIFDPFYTTKEIGKGTGLGLSISKSLIERHGGRIFVDQSMPNTCFVVELRKDHDLSRNAA